MEPMTLGSPTTPAGSPNTSGVLPGFLMGEPSSRSTTFSPPKKTLSFATSPTTIQYQSQYQPTSSTDSPGHQQSHFGNTSSFNRSLVLSPGGGSTHQQSKLFKYHSTAHENTITAPPTVGLFDSLRDERNNVTPRQIGSGSGQQQQQQQTLGYGMNQTQQQQQQDQSFSNTSGFNYSRVMSPIQNTSNTSHDLPVRGPKAPYTSFWITVFGFPQSSAGTVLNHFAQVGTIIDKVIPPQNSNWLHIRFSSRMECDKALNYNGKVIANSLMIGVLPCTDSGLVNEEVQENREPIKIRSLARATYETSQSGTAVEPSVFAPKMNNGIVSKAMDLFFGW